MTKITIGARGSKLSLAYVEKVKKLLLSMNKDLKEENINFKAIKTSGDINQNIKLSEIGGKNLFCKEIEEKLITAYKRIRSNVKNGLAIVPVERGASGGSYFFIPPQIQLEIASRSKIIMDEHSGRILVDPKLAAEEQAKIKKLIGT